MITLHECRRKKNTKLTTMMTKSTKTWDAQDVASHRRCVWPVRPARKRCARRNSMWLALCSPTCWFHIISGHDDAEDIMTGLLTDVIDVNDSQIDNSVIHMACTPHNRVRSMRSLCVRRKCYAPSIPGVSGTQPQKANNYFQGFVNFDNLFRLDFRCNTYQCFKSRIGKKMHSLGNFM